MKPKLLSLVVLLAVLISSNGFSATIGTWFGCPAPDPNKPAVDANKPACLPRTGSWKEAYWNGPNNPGIHLPPGPGASKDEIKITRAKTVCTLDSDAGNYLCKLSIAGGSEESNAPRLEITAGGQIGIGEFRVGAGGSTASGPIGCVNQTGGTVKLGEDLLVGRYGTSSKNPNEGKGIYTISGGTITCDAANTKAGLYIGGAGSAGQSEGIFTVIGSTANINFKKLNIGSDGAHTGCSGTVEFKIGSSGISPIRVSNGINIDPSNENSTKLIVSATAESPKADVLLIENQGNEPVNGTFDTVNGNPAPEGASVVLSFGGNNYGYNLTYKGGAGNNDIMLRYVPQPATAPAPVPPVPAAPKSE